jgi:hypothetical protein
LTHLSPKKEYTPMAKLLKRPAAATPAPTKAVSKKAPPAAPTKAVSKKAPARQVEEDEDDAPRTRRTSMKGGVAGKGGAAGSVASGWGGAEQIRNSLTPWAKPLTLKDGEAVVLRFLEDEPYATVRTHWVDRKGKRSFICLGDGCPLCAIGDPVKATTNFNVVQLTDGPPILLSWETNNTNFNLVKKANGDPRHGPLSKKFYTLSRTGSKMNDTVYSLAVVKRIEDIEEDFPNLYVPTEDEIEAMQEDRYTAEKVLESASPKHELTKIAAELSGEDEPDDDD